MVGRVQMGSHSVAIPLVTVSGGRPGRVVSVKGSSPSTTEGDVKAAGLLTHLDRAKQIEFGPKGIQIHFSPISVWHLRLDTDTPSLKSGFETQFLPLSGPQAVELREKMTAIRQEAWGDQSLAHHYGLLYKALRDKSVQWEPGYQRGTWQSPLGEITVTPGEKAWQLTKASPQGEFKGSTSLLLKPKHGCFQNLNDFVSPKSFWAQLHRLAATLLA